MIADIWSPEFDLGFYSGYLEKSNVNIPENVKIGDKICVFDEYICIVEGISIINGKTVLKLNVVEIC